MKIDVADFRIASECPKWTASYVSKIPAVDHGFWLSALNRWRQKTFHAQGLNTFRAQAKKKVKPYIDDRKFWLAIYRARWQEFLPKVVKGFGFGKICILPPTRQLGRKTHRNNN